MGAGPEEQLNSSDPAACGQSVCVTISEDLFVELSKKAQTRPEGLGTVEKLDKGVHSIGKKVIEKADEVQMAAEYGSLDDCALEISQLSYRAQVMTIVKGLSLEDAYQHL